jgi:transposase
MARPASKPGRKPKIGAAEEALLRRWPQEQPGLTLAELQARLEQQAEVKIHNSCLCRWLKGMGERLKKSRSTPPKATRPRSRFAAGSFWRP